MKFEEVWPRDFRGEVIQRCERMDGHSHKCTLVGYFSREKNYPTSNKNALKIPNKPSNLLDTFFGH